MNGSANRLRFLDGVVSDGLEVHAGSLVEHVSAACGCAATWRLRDTVQPREESWQLHRMAPTWVFVCRHRCS